MKIILAKMNLFYIHGECTKFLPNTYHVLNEKYPQLQPTKKFHSKEYKFYRHHNKFTNLQQLFSSS